MEGYPFGSVAPFALDSDGAPFFFFSGMAVHTKNLQANSNASLFVQESAGAGGVEGGRANLFGTIRVVTEAGDIARMREIYLARHPESEQWIGFGDFDFYRMSITNVYWVGGFGEMGWTSAEAYQSLLNT